MCLIKEVDIKLSLDSSCCIKKFIAIIGILLKHKKIVVELNKYFSLF